MADQADDLTSRIRAAVEWARAEEQRLWFESNTGGENATAAAIRANAFSVTCTVLEEVLEPGSHSGRE